MRGREELSETKLWWKSKLYESVEENHCKNAMESVKNYGIEEAATDMFGEITQINYREPAAVRAK
jgi:hypothetical protein